MYIKLRDALKDLLKEEKLTINDILIAMSEMKEDLTYALQRRTRLKKEEVRQLIEIYGERRINLLLFILQTFYLSNHSGLYKGRIIIPLREEIINNEKATRSGLRQLLRETEIRIRRK